MNTPSPDSGYDLRLVVEVPLRLFAPWLASVLVVTWSGYPGVICITPMAWLIGLAVGLRCAASSRSPSRSRRVQEAALAGALLGFLQGLLFIFISARLGPISDSEQASALGLSLVLLCAGIFASAGLSALNAWLYLQRRGAGHGI